MKQKFTLSILIVFSIVLTAQDKVSKVDEEIIGYTYYDLQTWRTMQNRIYYFDDGSMGAVWNMGMDFPNFPDLGIGYNYFDGDSWGPDPWQSITSGWAVYPSYTAYGENGEMCVSQGENGLIISIRETKGTGAWQQSNFIGSGLKHPVVITSGPNHNIIQLLYLKADESFNPTPAQPYRGFIWYARSSDGGQNWDINQQIPELGPDNYLGFTIGSYCWAEPKGDVISFVAGDYLTDLVLMKSDDGGDTWQKTVIWEHPYPMFEIFSFESDSFYCNGGGMDIVLDNDNMAHVAFGLSRVFSSIQQDTLWNDPFVDGIVYWREDMPGFKNTMNSLHPDSLSICDNLIGWTQDVNGNGSINIISPGEYPTLGISTMPNLVIDDMDRLFLIYSSVTELYDNFTENYNHLWMRMSPDGGCYWSDFADLTDDLIHIFDDCVYPSVACRVDDEIQLVYQHDNEPGLALGGGDPFGENFIRHMEIDLWEFDKKSEKGIYVDFRINQDSIFEGDTVRFQNLACGCPYPYSFDWEFEGGTPTLSSEINPWIVYSSAGIYDVSLTANNGSSAVEIKPDYIKVYPYTAISNHKKSNGVQIFPNPGNGLFTINLNLGKTDDLKIEVYNILGENILQYPVGNVEDKFRLDLTQQENGIYFIQIKNGSTIVTKKVAVQH